MGQCLLKHNKYTFKNFTLNITSCSISIYDYFVLITSPIYFDFFLISYIIVIAYKTHSLNNYSFRSFKPILRMDATSITVSESILHFLILNHEITKSCVCINSYVCDISYKSRNIGQANFGIQ